MLINGQVNDANRSNALKPTHALLEFVNKYLEDMCRFGPTALHTTEEVAAALQDSAASKQDPSPPPKID